MRYIHRASLLLVALSLSVASFTSCKGIEGFNDTSNSVDNSTNDSNNIIDNSLNLTEDSEGNDPLGDSDDGFNPDCSENINGTDGVGGFLWKPESESDGNLVILFPAEYDVRFMAVSVFLPDGTVEDGEFRGFTNGDRQTWRFNRFGGEYTGRIIVDATSQECVFFVENPSERQD